MSNLFCVVNKVRKCPKTLDKNVSSDRSAGWEPRLHGVGRRDGQQQAPTQKKELLILIQTNEMIPKFGFDVDMDVQNSPPCIHSQQ